MLRPAFVTLFALMSIGPALAQDAAGNCTGFGLDDDTANVELRRVSTGDARLFFFDNPDQHPFTYARVIGVFHVDVVHNVPGASTVPQSIPFLWVRRFRLDRRFKGGFKRKRLHRIEFLPDSDPASFGFVNPDEVIRGAHLIPAFAHGPTERVPYTSLARRKDEFDDWAYHYVNLYVLLHVSDAPI